MDKTLRQIDQDLVESMRERNLENTRGVVDGDTFDAISAEMREVVKGYDFNRDDDLSEWANRIDALAATLARQLAEAKARVDRIDRIAGTGTSESFLALSDDDKREWFAMHFIESTRRKEAESALAAATRRLGAWRNRFVSERTGTHQASGMSYELARACAESDANEYADGLEAALTKEPTK